MGTLDAVPLREWRVASMGPPPPAVCVLSHRWRIGRSCDSAPTPAAHRRKVHEPFMANTEPPDTPWREAFAQGAGREPGAWPER